MRIIHMTHQLQTWTEKLIRASKNFLTTLYTRVRESIAKLDEADDAQGWTTEELINMSESLAQAYCPGMGKFTQSPSPTEEDEWNTGKLVNLGESLTEGFSGQTVPHC
jgi:hypothetical protein